MSSGLGLGSSGTSRKRGAATLLSSSSSTATTAIAAHEQHQHQNPPPTRRARRDVLSCELESMRAELEHERSLRAIDAKRFVQTKQRLEQRCEFAMDEASDCKALLEELRAEHDKHSEQLRRALARTKEELRDVREELDEEREAAAMHPGNRQQQQQQQSHRWPKEELAAARAENQQLRKANEELRTQLRAEQQQQQIHHSAAAAASTDENSPPLSEARPEVLRELNQVRIRLAETERKNRQYKRIAEDAQRKARQLVHEQERAGSAHRRLVKMEHDLSEAVRAEAESSERLAEWRSLGQAMAEVLGADPSVVGMATATATATSASASASAGADLSALRKCLLGAKGRAETAQAQTAKLRSDLEAAGETIRALELETTSFSRKETTWEEERKEHETRLRLHQKDIAVLRGQEDIYKREVESLRSIIATFDSLPLTASQGGGSTGANQSQGTGKGTGTRTRTSPPSNLRVLEASLAAAREEVAVLKEANGSLRDDLTASVTTKEDLQKKHSTVLEKFGKLKDALYAERARAEKAAERANEAEILAGKGAFNPEWTRVLRLGGGATPLTKALRDEIAVLKKQVEVLSGKVAVAGAGAVAGGDPKKNKAAAAAAVAAAGALDVDPNKLHQRLKQSFKEQISRFREGVYLMTGFKVEMIPDNHDRYTFKVRSVFAERERDYLVFQWPEGKEVTSLDLLTTEYAKLLTKSPSYEYMTKFHSLPAFLASVQLTLFEKQTMI